MESREQRILTLATTLKSSGIAKTDSQAKMMAEEMIGVEEHVQKRYEESHTEAHEYLKTAKNLGASRVTGAASNPEQKPELQSGPKPAGKIEQIPTRTTNVKSEVPTIDQLRQATQATSSILGNSTRAIPNVDTDIGFENKPLNKMTENDVHDTHNPALEAIKAQMSTQKIVSLEDRYSSEVPSKKSDVPEVISNDVPEIVSKSSEEILEEPQKPDVSPVLASELISEPVQESNVEDSVVKETEVQELRPQLDAQKLVEMMEEDGKLEEHTREIKEKPKDVKPKEEYAENSIDLASVFSFNKR